MTPGDIALLYPFSAAGFSTNLGKGADTSQGSKWECISYACTRYGSLVRGKLVCGCELNGCVLGMCAHVCYGACVFSWWSMWLACLLCLRMSLCVCVSWCVPMCVVVCVPGCLSRWASAFLCRVTRWVFGSVNTCLMQHVFGSMWACGLVWPSLGVTHR